MQRRQIHIFPHNSLKCRLLCLWLHVFTFCPSQQKAHAQNDIFPHKAREHAFVLYSTGNSITRGNGECTRNWSSAPHAGFLCKKFIFISKMTQMQIFIHLPPHKNVAELVGWNVALQHHPGFISPRASATATGKDPREPDGMQERNRVNEMMLQWYKTNWFYNLSLIYSLFIITGL